jgi:hypothetical protein
MRSSRCFILGAGFSKCCDLPLASELTPIVWRSLARKDPLDRSGSPALCQPSDIGYPSLEADLRWIQRLFPDCECDPERDDSWPDFEQLITALDDASKFQVAYERTTNCQRTQNWAEHARHELMYHMQRRLSELTEDAPRSGLDLIRDFIRGVDSDRDAVISFNWDVLLEIAADEIGVAVHYRSDLGPGLRLAKPHGSLNLVDSAVGDYNAARDSCNVHGLNTELEYQNEELRTVLRVQKPQDTWRRQAWSKEQPLLIEPNVRKVYDNLWIELQWARALDMVREADEIVVIGFSLPETDLRPRILLQLSRLNRQSPPRLILVDPNAPELCKHYSSLTGLAAVPLEGKLDNWLSR